MRLLGESLPALDYNQLFTEGQRRGARLDCLPITRARKAALSHPAPGRGLCHPEQAKQSSSHPCQGTRLGQQVSAKLTGGSPLAWEGVAWLEVPGKVPSTVPACQTAAVGSAAVREQDSPWLGGYPVEATMPRH